MRGWTGGLYRFTEWVMRLAVINILWLVFSIPFLFFLLPVFFSPDLTRDVLLSTLWILAIISPFTLIPASAAMFAVARKWVMGDEDVPLLKTFFRGYKDNYKQSMLGGIIFIVIGGVLLVNLTFYRSSPTFQWLSLLFIVLLVFWVVSLINYLNMVVHYNMKTIQLIKNTVMISLGQPILSFMLLAVNFAILYVSTKFAPIFAFFTGSASAYMSFFIFNRGLDRMHQKVQALREKRGLVEKEEDGAEDNQLTNV